MIFFPLRFIRYSILFMAIHHAIQRIIIVYLNFIFSHEKMKFIFFYYRSGHQMSTTFRFLLSLWPECDCQRPWMLIHCAMFFSVIISANIHSFIFFFESGVFFSFQQVHYNHQFFKINENDQWIDWKNNDDDDHKANTRSNMTVFFQT